MRVGMSLIVLLGGSLLCLSFAQRKDAAGTPARIEPSSGKAMCAILSVSDLAKAGVPMTAIAAQNSDDETNAYCGFQGKSGGAELDVFLPAGDTPEQAIGVERTVYGEVGGHFQPVTIAGVDSAQINLAVPGKKPSAGIVVRRGLAVFTLNIPANPHAREQLLSLAQTVLSRLPPRDKPAK
jgi:hypothetical protein